MSSANEQELLQGSNVRVIQPKKGLVPLDLRELWRYRELFFQLSWRSVLIRYKQTYLGVAWAVVQPVLTTVIFVVVFGNLAKIPTDGAPGSLLVFSAMLPWQFFSNALTESSNSLLASQNMVTKVYFPRLIIPGSAVLSGGLDFLIGFAILLCLMAWHKVPLTINLLFLPLFFAMTFFISLAVGFWFSAMSVKYRDVKYVVPFLVRMGIYVCPVGFTSKWVAGKISSTWFACYASLNPMVGIIDGFRWCVLGPKFVPYWPEFWCSMAVLLVVLVSGAYYFRGTEKTFADVI